MQEQEPDISRIKNAVIAEILDHEEKGRMQGLAEQELGIFSQIFDFRSTAGKIRKRLSEAGEKISKYDLLRDYNYGNFFMSSPKSWDGFLRFNAEIKKNGEVFTAEDFRVPLVPVRSQIALDSAHNFPTLLDQAYNNDRLEQIFNTEIWDTRREEMLDMWFGMPASYRNKMDIQPVLDEMAKRSKKPARVDQLMSAFVSVRDIRAALKAGDFDEIAEKLKTKKLKLEKQDFFLLDASGDSAFDHWTSLRHLDVLHAWLKDQGDSLTIEDMTRSFGGKGTLLDRILQEGDLGKLFTASLWHDRLEEMDELYRRLPLSKREQIDYDKLRDEAAAFGFERIIKIDAKLTKKRLLMPWSGQRNATVESLAQSRTIMPLALSSTWEKFAEIQTHLARKNQALTLEDLRAHNPDDGIPYLNIGVRQKQFEAIEQSILAKGSDRLTAEDLTRRYGPEQRNLLDELMRHDQLQRIFKPEAWVGRVHELRTVIQALPEEFKTAEPRPDWKKTEEYSSWAEEYNLPDQGYDPVDFKALLREVNLRTAQSLGRDSKNKPIPTL